MADHLEEMPLFLLSTVLFPFSSVRLHVFEDRYRELVRLCLEEDRMFGVVLIRSGQEVGGPAEPYLVGTAVKIRQAYQFDDGTMDLHVQGEHRFRIRHLSEDQPYLVGHVETLAEADYEVTDATETLVGECTEAFETWCSHSFARQEMNVTIQFPPEWTARSFSMASWLPVDNLAKQQLLELTDTVERYEAMYPVLSDLLAQGTPAVAAEFTRVHSSELEEWISSN